MSATATPDITLTGRFELTDEMTYRHLPFGVPAGIRQLHLSIEYNARIGSSPTLRGGNTLDIGLFDARGAESGGDGFRGWSGSEKTEITIGRDWATPPYRAGAPQAGEWRLLLGAYKVAPEGLDYRAEIWFDPGLEPEPVDAVSIADTAVESRVPALEAGWVRGDLHCHSTHSDGDSPPEVLLAKAKSLGFDFLGITDHNAPPFSGQAPADGPLLIPGTEVTTYGGHCNVWGGSRWYDFREPTREAMAREMALARQTAGLVSVNHPRPMGPDWEYGLDLPFQTLEVWNGPWMAFNAISLVVWDDLLQEGRRVPAIGGSDTHQLKGANDGFLPRPKLGEPTVWVKPDGPLTIESVLDGLQQGRIFLSESPDGPQLILDRNGPDALRLHMGGAKGDTLMLIGGSGLLDSHVIDRDDWSMIFPFPVGEPYVRAQIVDQALNMKALSNPIWRDPADE
jgi:hypothetical protein